MSDEEKKRGIELLQDLQIQKLRILFDIVYEGVSRAPNTHHLGELPMWQNLLSRAVEDARVISAQCYKPQLKGGPLSFSATYSHGAPSPTINENIYSENKSRYIDTLPTSKRGTFDMPAKYSLFDENRSRTFVSTSDIGVPTMK